MFLLFNCFRRLLSLFEFCFRFVRFVEYHAFDQIWVSVNNLLNHSDISTNSELIFWQHSAEFSTHHTLTGKLFLTDHMQQNGQIGKNRSQEFPCHGSIVYDTLQFMLYWSSQCLVIACFWRYLTKGGFRGGAPGSPPPKIFPNTIFYYNIA